MKPSAKRRSWFVDTETTLAHVLAALGEDEAAVEEGRVFIGRIRARTADARVASGMRVDVTARPAGSASDRLPVLAQNDDWIAVNKPAGIATVADHANASHCLHTLVANHLQMSVRAVQPTSRLDRDVSGVVIFASSALGYEELMIAREHNTYRRRYVAIAEYSTGSEALAEEGIWDASIGRASNPLLRAVNGPEAKVAATNYRVVATEGRFVALVVFPQTGRTHQIRVHASHAGAPLLGDAAYGGKRRLTSPRGSVIALDRIFLHACEVAVAGERYLAPLPEAFVQTWSAISSDEDAWKRAFEVPFP